MPINNTDATNNFLSAFCQKKKQFTFNSKDLSLNHYLITHGKYIANYLKCYPGAFNQGAGLHTNCFLFSTLFIDELSGERYVL